MHAILTPVGSSGDVNPYVGVGRALRGRGHDVTVITNGTFEGVTRGAGLDFVSNSPAEEFEALASYPHMWHPVKGMQHVLRVLRDRMRAGYDLLDGVYRPGQSIVVGHTLSVSTRVFEEARGAPAVTMHIAPSIFRTDFQQPVLHPGRDLSKLPAWMHRTSWWLGDRFLIDPHIVPALNRWRKELGLDPVSRIFKDWVHSPQRVIGLFPPWFGPPQPDWPSATRLTGFPLFDADEQHDGDPELERFFDSGDPPVLFTAGTAHQHSRTFFTTAAAAAAEIGRRAVLITRYPDQLPNPMPSHVRRASYVPFSRILPRCAAIVHHGGIGTCAQALATGVPQLITPMAFDQPDNAARIRRLGVGSALPLPRFTIRRAAAALRALIEDPRTAECCARWRAECDGPAWVEQTCDLIEGAFAARDRGHQS